MLHHMNNVSFNCDSLLPRLIQTTHRNRRAGAEAATPLIHHHQCRGLSLPRDQHPTPMGTGSVYIRNSFKSGPLNQNTFAVPVPCWCTFQPPKLFLWLCNQMGGGGRGHLLSLQNSSASLGYPENFIAAPPPHFLASLPLLHLISTGNCITLHLVRHSMYSLALFDWLILPSPHAVSQY